MVKNDTCPSFRWTVIAYFSPIDNDDDGDDDDDDDDDDVNDTIFANRAGDKNIN